MTVKTRTVEEQVVVCDACGKEMPFYGESKEGRLLEAIGNTGYTRHVKPGAKRKGSMYSPDDCWCLCRDGQRKLKSEHRRIKKEADRMRDEALCRTVKQLPSRGASDGLTPS